MLLVKFLKQNGLSLSDVDREVKQGRIEYYYKNGKTCLRKVSINSFTLPSKPLTIPSLSSMLGWS